MKNINKIRERNLLQILRDEVLITQDQMTSILEEQNLSGELLIDIVLKNEYVTERDLAKALVKNYQLPFIYPEDYQISKDVRELIPNTLLHTHKLYPVDMFGNILVMVTSGNISQENIKEIEKAVQKDVALYMAPHSAVLKVLKEEFPMDEISTEVSSRMDELFGGGS